MCRGFKLGDGEGPLLSFCSAARGKAGKRASPVRRLAAARSCAQPASLARQPNAGLRTCAQRQTDGSARSSLRDESRASAVFLFLGMSSPLHYRGPHPAHCAAWISVGPMVAIKWGLHTRNHTLEEPHTGELVDGDS